MNKYRLSGLSVAGGILTGLAWTSWCSGLILLVSFVPFLLIENHLYKYRSGYSPNAYFVYLIPGFVIFSIISLGWIRAASMIAAVAIITGMAFLMSFVLWLAHLIRLRYGNFAGALAFISLWLSFEYLSLNTVYLSPWINLGNGLAKDILFIQWYEVTGTGGGTLWILCSNLFLSILFLSYPNRKRIRKSFLVIWIGIIITPLIISIIRYYTINTDKDNAGEVVIVQPNYDPFTEKFTIPFTEQLDKVLEMAGWETRESTSWVITPETTVDDPVDENHPESDKYISSINDFASRYPAVNVVSGMVTSGPFNSAIQISKQGVSGIYHKSKLVPGFEMELPAGFERIIRKILPDIGGTSWGYGIQKERACFSHSVTGQVAGPIICYESIFGNYVADYVRKGAEVLFIITNDGWWKNTNGYEQHLAFASLRAIETRRPVARAANTGISCLIDIRGKRTHETKWWKEAVIKGKICSETSLTPYVRHGDYLLKLSLPMNAFIILLIFVIIPLKKKFQRQ